MVTPTNEEKRRLTNLTTLIKAKWRKLERTRLPVIYISIQWVLPLLLSCGSMSNWTSTNTQKQKGVCFSHPQRCVRTDPFQGTLEKVSVVRSNPWHNLTTHSRNWPLLHLTRKPRGPLPLVKWAPPPQGSRSSCSTDRQAWATQSQVTRLR